MRVSACFLAMWVLLWSGAARAAIVMIEDDRYVSHPTGGTFHSSLGTSLFDATASGPNSSASQVSYVSPDKFSAYSVVSVGGDGVGGDSVFDVRFDVDAPMSFDLTGSYAASDTAGMAFLSDSDGVVNTLTPFISLSGLLVPAKTYRLFIAVKTPPGGTPTGGGFSFTLIAPEPAPTLLVLLALALPFARVTPRGGVRCLRPPLRPAPPRASR